MTQKHAFPDRFGAMNTETERTPSPLDEAAVPDTAQSASPSRPDSDRLERRLHDFAIASSEWFWEMDENLRFFWFSDNASERIGRPYVLLLGKTRREIGAADDDHEKWARHFAALDAHQPFRKFRYRAGIPSGETVYLEVSGVPVFGKDGTFRGYRGSGCNVTAEVEATQRVCEAEECLKLAFQTSTSPTGITRLEDGLFITANDAMAQVLGCETDDIIGRRSVEVGFWGSTANRTAWREQLREKGSLRSFEFQFIGGNGQARYGLLSASLFSIRGEPHALVSIDDNTEAVRTRFEIRKLLQALEQSSAAVVITDARGEIEYVNASFVAMTGYSAIEVKGQTPRILKSGRTPDAEYRRLWATIRDGQPFRGEICNRRKDGSLYWASMHISPVKNENDEITHFISVQSDTTERRRAEEELRASEERLRSLVESSLLGICIEQDGRPVFVNQTFAGIFGYERPADVLALGSCESLWAKEDLARVARLQARGPEGDAASSCHELLGRRQDGADVYLLVQVKAIPWDGQPATQLSVVDITLRKRFETRLQFQASYDALTNLPNRALALDRLSTAVRAARRRAAKVGVLYIDFDHFKKINDTFGHAGGDAFLQEAARRIALAVRDEDTVARMGGDEFVVILPSIKVENDAQSVALRILERLKPVFRLMGQEIFVGASIGIATFPEHGENAESLLQHADAAMYVAKSEGRGNVQLFTHELSRRSEKRVRLETELRRALEHEQLSLVYQPLIDVDSQEVVGAEGLLRWSHPQLGEVSPEEFVRVAEETGLILDIGDWVLRRSCSDASTWIERGFSDVGLSINVSSRQFRQVSLAASVRRAIADARLCPSVLEIEITESLLIEDIDRTLLTLRDLRGCGVRIAVDDFGTGYSSLSYLTRFPITTLKVDRSFIRGMHDDGMQATMVDALIALGHRLGLRVIAEGVENREQLAFLAARHCDAAQGFLFSRPLPLLDFHAFLEGWSNQPKSKKSRGAASTVGTSVSGNGSNPPTVCFESAR